MENNPLTKEQIEKIKQIQTLSGEDQKKEWEEFLKGLSEEQYKFLLQKNKQQEDASCFFCELIKGSVQTYKLHEDENVLVILDINPANIGHSLVIPKEHLVNSFDKEDIGYFFNVANLVAKRIKEKLGKDSNIFVANGVNAGQKGQHFLIHVIPREENDKVNFTWSGSPREEKDLEETKELLKIKVEEKEESKEIEEVTGEEIRIP